MFNVSQISNVQFNSALLLMGGDWYTNVPFEQKQHSTRLVNQLTRHKVITHLNLGTDFFPLTLVASNKFMHMS